MNINSGKYTGKYIGAATLAHEITHALQDYDKAQYGELKDFITSEVLSEEELARLVNVQLNLEPNLTPGAALDEVIANGCAKMLLDSEAIQKLAEENRTLFGWIKDKIDEITGSINAAYEEIDLSDDLDVYKAARAFQKAQAEIRERFNNILLTANANKGAEKITGKKISADGGRVQNMAIDNKRNVIVDEDVTPQTVLKTLTDIINEETEDRDFTFPLLKHTPQVYIDQCDFTDRSVVMHANKAWEAMRDDKADYHALGISGMVRIICGMFNPDSIIYQTKGRNAERYAAVIKDEQGEALAVIEFDDRRQGKGSVAGEDGRYNTLVTAYDKLLPWMDYETFSDYVDSLYEKEGNYEVYERKGDNKYEVPEEWLVLSEQLSGQLSETSFDMSITEEAGKIKSQNQKLSAEDKAWDEMTEEEKQAEINSSMTMQQAKTMVEKAYTAAGIREWYDGKYRNGDEWLKAEGSSEVAMYIENEYELQRKYINSNPRIVDYEYTIEDVLDAYLNGTLTGKTKAAKTRVDASQSRGYQDSRFYAPNFGKADAETWAKANEKVTKKNQDEVYEARKNILLAAHAGNIEQTLGITSSELNKKLRSWSRYSASARSTSESINRNVAAENQWTGIQNSSILNGMSVSDEDIRSMVKDITGESSEYQRRYIGNAMLALDTHIDWSWLSFEFKRGAADPNRRSVRGFYNNNDRKITIGGSSYQNTVSHEMGHALDSQWERELFGQKREGYLSENSYKDSLIPDDEGRQFYRNFRSFVDDLTDVNVNYSEYTMEPKEVFARFIAKFVEWTQSTAGAYVYTDSLIDYGDKFSSRHYVEFAKLLQEKAAWDAKRATEGKAQYQKLGISETEEEKKARAKAFSDLKAENRILKTRAEYWKSQTRKTKANTVRQQDVNKLTNELLKKYDSRADKEGIRNSLQELGNWLVQTSGENLSYDELYAKAEAIAEEIIDENYVLLDNSQKEMRDRRLSADKKVPEAKASGTFLFMILLTSAGCGRSSPGAEAAPSRRGSSARCRPDARCRAPRPSWSRRRAPGWSCGRC